MKILKILIFLITTNSVFAVSITPFKFDLVGIEQSGDTIVVYGNQGSAYYSYENGETWNYVHILDSGEIRNFFFEEDRYIAFFIDGNIAISNSLNESWQYHRNIGEKIVQVEKIDQDYYILSVDKLLILDKEFNIKKSKILDATYFITEYGKTGDISLSYKFSEKMGVFNNELFLVKNGSINKYNKELILTDSLSMKNINDCNSCNFNSIISGNNKIWATSTFSENNIMTNRKLYDISNFQDVTYVTDLLKNENNAFDEESSAVHHIRFTNGSLIFLNPKFDNEKKNRPGYVVYKLDEENISNNIEEFGNLFFDAEKGEAHKDGAHTDYILLDNLILLVDHSSYISLTNMNNNEYKELSNLKKMDLNKDLPPIERNDGNILFPSINKLLMSENDSFLKPIDLDTMFYDSKYELKYQKYDEVNNVLFRIYKENVFQNHSWLLYYDFKENISVIKNLDSLSLAGTSTITNINLINKELLITKYSRGNNYYTFNHLYDSLFNIKKVIKDSVFTIDFISTNKKGEYFIVSSDSNRISVNNLTHIKKSFDLNGDWEIIKSYEFGTDTIVSSDGSKSLFIYSKLIGYKDIVYNKVRYLMLTSYNRETKEYVIELMDYDNHEFIEIYNAKYETLPTNAHTVYKDTNYISINDTLFTINDIFDKETWTHHILPHNGKILGRISRIKDRFFARYLDDTREIDYYWISLESGVSTVEKSVEILPYTYVDTPYPNPVLNGEVTFDVYVSGNAELKKENIRIYDINGTLVSKESDINLSTGNNWPASVRWECSSQQSGVYFAIIDANGIEKLVKIIVQ